MNTYATGAPKLEEEAFTPLEGYVLLNFVPYGSF